GKKESWPTRIPGYSVIGIVFTLLSSSVMCPSQAGSMKPAVLWMRRPRRPRLDFPSTRETRSSARRMRSRVEPRTNSPGCRMNAVPRSTSTSSVMSSSGSARSMYGCRLERKTRKKRSRRMSTLAGCTQSGSNGSMPMRPDATAARISRSERTTTTEYGVVESGKPEHGAPELRPGAHEPVRPGERRLRVAPPDLQRAHPGGARHLDVRGRVAHDGAGRGQHAEALRRREREIGRGLVPGHGVAPQIGVDLAPDAQPAQDPLAVRRALAGDRGLQQARPMERAQRHTRTAEEPRRGDDLALVDLPVLADVSLEHVGREVRPREREDRRERQSGHRADPVD